VSALTDEYLWSVLKHIPGIEGVLGRRTYLKAFARNCGSNVIFERNYQLDNGKIISRICVEIENISINNKSTWHKVFEFFDKNMTFLEQFFYEYGDYIKDLEINT
jgi:hypothetical protein